MPNHELLIRIQLSVCEIHKMKHYVQVLRIMLHCVGCLTNVCDEIAVFRAILQIELTWIDYLIKDPIESERRAFVVIQLGSRKFFYCEGYANFLNLDIVVVRERFRRGIGDLDFLDR